MKKKFLAIYALTGALVASPVFTSCVDDTVSPQVEAQREANIKYKNALTAQTEANTAINQANAANNQAMAALNQEAKRLENEAKAAQNAYDAAMNALKLAEKELDNAEKELDNAIKAYNQALTEKKEAMVLEEMQVAIEQAKANVEKTKADAEKTKADAEQTKANAEAKQLENEMAKATLELDIIKAKLDAEALNAKAKAELLEAQAKLEKVIKGLELKEQAVAEQLRKNAVAIMQGGTANFEALNSWSSNDEMSKTYESTYSKGGINSILALNNGLVAENMNLLRLENDLVDINTWIAKQVKGYEAEIATQEALIAMYKELQTAGSNREAMEKAYEKAKENAEKLGIEVEEIKADIYNAEEALSAHKTAMFETTIAKLTPNCDYLTEQEELEVYADTVTLLNGKVRVYEKELDAVYEHTAEDAEKLADDIKKKEDKIATYEADLEKVNSDDRQRMLAVAKANADAVQEIYDEVKASEAYKTKLAELEKDVADAQAEFDKNPTDFEAYDVTTENADGTSTTKTVKSTKQLLEEAESALENVDDNYIAVEDNEETADVNEQKTLGDLYDELNVNATKTGFTYRIYEGETYDDEQGAWVENWSEVELEEAGLNGVVDFWEEQVNEYISGIEEDLGEAKEDLEELKELQAILAADSKEMKEYAELCEKRAELQKAVYALESDKLELEANKDYWDTLETKLLAFVGNEDTEGSLPDWADLIAGAEKTIATKKADIAEIADADSDDTNSTVESKISKEAAIALKKAEIEAMEAELEERQAEYDAVMAELEALLEAETEVAE